MDWRKNLEVVREQGFALDNEEFDLGVRCIAAPIFDYREKVIGSIGISGPVTTHDGESNAAFR